MFTRYQLFQLALSATCLEQSAGQSMARLSIASPSSTSYRSGLFIDSFIKQGIAHYKILLHKVVYNIFLLAIYSFI